MPTQHATASTGRRGSGMTATTSSHAHGPNRARMDANLRMSSKGGGEETTTVTSHARNKSSDRLHKLAAGHSSGHLAAHGTKRSKSYTQIMNATGTEKATASTARKNKLKRGRSEGQAQADGEDREGGKEDADGDDDGWTSADQTTTDTDNLPSNPESDDEEEGVLTFGGGGKKRDVEGTETNAKAVEESRATGPPEEEDAAQSEEHHSATNRRSSEDTLAVAEQPVDPTTPVQSTFSTESSAAPADLPRQSSSTSVQTLTGSGAIGYSTQDVSVSPSTTTASFQQRRSIMPRNSHHHAAPPKLSTEYAFAGAGNGSERMARSLHRSSDSDVGAMVSSVSNASRLTGDRSTDSAPHYRFSTIDYSTGSASDFQPRRRKTSVSSARSSVINLPGVSPSLGTISHDLVNAESTGAQTSRAIEAMQRATLVGMRASQSSSTLPRERTRSTQSSGSTEAARLANKLRMARGDKLDEDAGSSPVQSTSASRMLANSGTKYFMGNKADSTTAKAMARYNKPTASVFVNRQDDFKSIEKIVEPGNLFDERFARASLGGVGEGDEGHDNATGQKANAVQERRVRYLMEYGLSGSAIDKNATTQALLSTCLDNDEFEASWAPALTQAAGLGSNSNKNGEAGGDGYGGPISNDGTAGMAAGLGGGVFVNGPNATPLHFLHGLTNTNDSAFPLDEADVLPVGADGVPHPSLGLGNGPSRGEYIDAKNLRAIALTWAALNTTKNHIVTRRYVDPMRESLERVMEAASGGVKREGNTHGSLLSDVQLGKTTSQGTGSGVHTGGDEYRSGAPPTPGSGSSTPGGTLRWGWRSLFADQTPHE